MFEHDPAASGDILLEPTTIGRTALRNRVSVAPMTRVSAGATGEANDRIARYYRRFAKGGFGLITTEGLSVDTDHSPGYLFQPGLATAAHVESWRPVVDGVHEAGAALFAQLMHAGSQSQGNPYNEGSRGPSAVAPKGEQLGFYRGSGPYAVPEAMTRAEMAAVREAFVRAARNAAAAGFDGVELHGANGYLLDEFLTDYLNRREDGYGGTTRNRVRYAAEVCDAVMQAVGDDLTVGIRVSQAKVSDPHHRWAGGEDDARSIFGGLGATGLHFIHTTEYRATEPAFAPGGPTLYELAVRHGGTAVIANGHLDDPETARTVLRAGVGVVALGKPALAHPDWPERIRGGAAVGGEPAPDLLSPLADVKDSELDPV